eukprot:m.30572 g.30572  ORF g.30572 m.30572 type:complete len:679 (+) comp8212_c0_seq1:116-2152(+)
MPKIRYLFIVAMVLFQYGKARKLNERHMDYLKAHSDSKADVTSTAIENSTKTRGDTSRKRRQACSNPTRVADVKFPDKIIGTCHVNYQIKSGYMPVSHGEFLFYIYVSPKRMVDDAPVIMWTNGGPGCSSMEGMFTEISPLILKHIKINKQTNHGQLSDNPYSWNDRAHLLFVDQPRHVGFSTVNSGSSCSSSLEAAQDIIKFYNEWRKDFSHLSNNRLIIAGESKAGQYVPAWGKAILDYNNQVANDELKINLKGILMGNACTDYALQVNNPQPFIQFAKREKLLPETYSSGSRYAAESQIRSHLGYSPNFYDYRLAKLSCSGCYDYDYTGISAWLLRADVQEALHICSDAGNNAFGGTRGGCISMPSFDSRYESTDYFTKALAQALDAGIPVQLFYGKVDQACDYVGGEQMAQNLNWKGKEGFNAAPILDVKIAGGPAGQLREFGLLSFLYVESAGHMVPSDQPAAAFFAMDRLLFPQDHTLVPNQPNTQRPITQAPCPETSPVTECSCPSTEPPQPPPKCEPCTTQEPATPIDPNPCPTRPDCEPCICSTMEMANPTLPSTVTCPKCPEITPPLCPTCPAQEKCECPDVRPPLIESPTVNAPTTVHCNTDCQDVDSLKSSNSKLLRSTSGLAVMTVLLLVAVITLVCMLARGRMSHTIASGATHYNPVQSLEDDF